MAYHIPEDYYYTKDHEWAQVDENIVTVGITEFAQNQLGEVVYVELPEEGPKGHSKPTIWGCRER
jgi:glycine cleavage system H protein